MPARHFVKNEPDATPNPLDFIEGALKANGWSLKRNGKQLLTCYPGKWCDYHPFFMWSGEAEAVIFAIGLDGLEVKPRRRQRVDELLTLINNTLWLGHFDLSSEKKEPTFRHTLLLGGTSGMGDRQLEALVKVSLEACERFYPAFQYVIYGGDDCKQALTMASFDTVGEA